MSNLRLTPDVLIIKQQEFLNDPVIKEITNRIAKIYEYAVPSIILDVKKQEITYKYNIEVESAINDLFKLRTDYIQNRYPELIDTLP